MEYQPYKIEAVGPNFLFISGLENEINFYSNKNLSLARQEENQC